MKSYEPVFRSVAHSEAGPLGTTRAIITSLIGRPGRTIERAFHHIRGRAENHIKGGKIRRFLGTCGIAR